MPSKIWAVGEELLAADMNAYVQEQVVATFPNAAGRTAALAAPKAGMMTYLADVKRLDVYDGAAWVTVGGATRIAYTELATASDLAGSLVDILTAPFTVSSQRLVKITGHVSGQQITAGANLNVAVGLDTTYKRIWQRALALNEYYGVANGFYFTATAGAHTAKLQIDLAAGAFRVATSSPPRYLEVLDYGPG